MEYVYRYIVIERKSETRQRQTEWQIKKGEKQIYRQKDL